MGEIPGNKQESEKPEVFNIQVLIDKIEKIIKDPALGTVETYENVDPEMAELAFPIDSGLKEALKYLNRQKQAGREQFGDGSNDINDNIELIRNLDPLTRIKGLPESVAQAIEKDIKPLLRSLLQEANSNPKKFADHPLKILYPKQNGVVDGHTTSVVGTISTNGDWEKKGGRVAECYSPAVVQTDKENPDSKYPIHQAQVRTWE